MSVPMWEIAAQYQTRNTIFTSASSGWLRICQADPRRYYLHFIRLTAVGLQSSLMPAPVPSGFTPTTNEAFTGPFLFRDMPAAVTGEWYIFYNPGEEWNVIEQIFTGD